MQQLNLFGSLIHTPSAEEKPEEEQPMSMKEKNIASVFANEETSYSLVGLAEEMLGAESFIDTEEIIETTGLKVKSAEQSGDGARLSSSSPKTTQENLAEPVLTKRLQTSKVIIVEKETVVFENGKIAAKAKNKQLTTTAGTQEKAKKEPQKRGRKPLHEIESEVDLIEVPEDEELFKKQYYAISEVAKWFRVNTSLLRFWENEFEVLKPKKNRKGDRLFRPEDVKTLQLIHHLLRQRKYTIEGAREYIKTHRQKADIQLQLSNTLQKFKSFLLDLKANL